MTVTPDGRNIQDTIITDPATGIALGSAANPIHVTSGNSSSALAETLWTDDSGAFYVREDNGTTISWLTPTGASCSAPGTGIRPGSGASVSVVSQQFQATAAGTGIAINDFLSHIATMDPTSGVEVGSFWLNLTQNAKLASAPVTAMTMLSPLPTGAALAANQPAINADGGAQSHVMNWPTTQPISGVVSLVNGANTVAVKPASTNAAAADPALVIVHSPNGDNSLGSGSVSSAAVLFSISTAGFNSLSVIFSTGINNTIVFDGSNDNVTWQTGVTFFRPDLWSAAPYNSLYLNGVISAQVPVSYAYIRCRVSTWTSGTVTALYALKNNVSIPSVNNAATNALYVKSTDGTNIASVKAASTPAVAADPALVVALSPNSENMAGVTAAATLIGGTPVTFTAINQTSPALSTQGYQSMLVLCTSGGASTTIIWEGSDDNWTTYYPILASRMDVTSASAVSSVGGPSAGYMWDVPLKFAQVRLRCSAYTNAVTMQYSLKAGGVARMTVDQGAANGSSQWLTSSVAAAKASSSGLVAAASNVGSYPIVSAASNNATTIKSVAGQLFMADFCNNSASWAYLKLFNGAPTMGTTGAVASYGIPPGGSKTLSFADMGLYFSSGIYAAITAGIALNDNTSLAAANTVTGTFHYA